jgi:regulator of cell morphogenesis and NO signaling
MNRIANWLVHDHRKYDEALRDCEMAAEVSDWKTAVKLFKTFVEDLRLHMRMEDEVLYPLLEKESGDPNGDLDLLSDEHDDLVRLLGDLVHVIMIRDFDHFEESLQPLHKAMVRHNDHEEAVFMSLGTPSVLLRREEVLSQLDAMSTSSQQQDWNA